MSIVDLFREASAPTSEPKSAWTHSDDRGLFDAFKASLQRAKEENWPASSKLGLADYRAFMLLHFFAAEQLIEGGVVVEPDPNGVTGSGRYLIPGRFPAPDAATERNRQAASDLIRVPMLFGWRAYLEAGGKLALPPKIETQGGDTLGAPVSRAGNVAVAIVVTIGAVAVTIFAIDKGLDIYDRHLVRNAADRVFLKASGDYQEELARHREEEKKQGGSVVWGKALEVARERLLRAQGDFAASSSMSPLPSKFPSGKALDDAIQKVATGSVNIGYVLAVGAALVGGGYLLLSTRKA